ncbi:MAG: outer membrane lipoprotein-sorting protein [Bryobacteraceae bacterium]|nr:outer membrane lipoprotein-sorting protein [Bryobacteraceae bacterium]
MKLILGMCAMLAWSQPARPPVVTPHKTVAAPPHPEAPPDLDSIVRQSLQREMMNAKALDNYVYEAQEATITYDGNGRPSKTESKLTEYLWLEGSRFKRLIEENGKPLIGSAAVKEQRRMDAEIAKRRRESPSDRQKRLAEEEKRRAESRQTRDEVVKAFNFKLLGEDTVAGAKCWKVLAEPKPGYEGNTRISRLFPKMRGTIWVNQQGYQWLRVEAETLDAITFGGFLAKLDKGAQFHLEQMRVNENLWAMRQLTTRVTARARLMRFNQAQQIDFRNYRKFSAESRLLAPGAEAH